MSLLLDSHAIIWFLSGDHRCSPTARAAIEQENGNVFVSAASTWEIATKARLRRWPEAAPILADMDTAFADNDFARLAISLEHARFAGLLPGAHGDPFDRMLAAQARIEKLPLITADRIFRSFGIETIW